MREICLIVAMDERGAIGRAGAMPWHLPADLAHFKRMTLGHPVIMGRKTFESIGRPLPGRQNIVITRQAEWHAEGVEIAPGLTAALAMAAADLCFVIGGGEIYRMALPLADELFITRVGTTVSDPDTWFPALEPAAWIELSRHVRPADERNAHELVFHHYRRRPAIDAG